MAKYKGVPELEILEEAENYNKWIAESILFYVSSPLLEIGSGTGNITAYFLNKKPLYVTDQDSDLLLHLKKRFSKEKNLFINKFDITQKCPSNLKLKFSSVFGVNVLEHIKDDVAALRNIRESLVKKGKIVLLVPAKRFAYTRLDKNLGHFRRYEKEELINKLETAGFRVNKIYYFNIVGLLSWIIRDKIEREKISLSPKQIAIFDSIVPFLKKIESRINIPIGISFIVIGEKI